MPDEQRDPRLTPRDPSRRCHGCDGALTPIRGEHYVRVGEVWAWLCGRVRAHGRANGRGDGL